MINFLLSKGADPNALTIDHRTPLIEATSGTEELQKDVGHIDAVITLLKNGANPNLCDLMGRGPLHWACFNGHTKIGKTLIEKGANVKAADNELVQPIHLASFVGKPELVTILLEKGADPNALDIFQRTPLHYGVRGQSPDVLRVLTACKANVDLADDDGTTPSMLAEGQHMNEMLEILQKNSDQGRPKMKNNQSSSSSFTRPF